MNINEYKQNKVKEINRFFRGIHFQNIGVKDKEIIGGLTPECSDFFNNENTYRKLTEALFNKLNGYYIELVHTNIEYATSKEEIDYEIKMFIEKVMMEVNNYKHMLIKVVFQPIKEDKVTIDELQEVKEKNLINTGLNFIKLKVGDAVYSFPKLGIEFEKEYLVIENLIYVMTYVYFIIGCIEDKKQKQEEFVDFVATNFSVTDKDYFEVRKMQMIFLNEKDYETFLEKYKSTTEQVVATLIERDQNIRSGENNQKPKGK